MRSTEEVLSDHLERRCRHDLDGDLAHNYSEGLIVISKDGVFHGKDGIRNTARTLESCLPNAKFSYDIVRTEGDIGFLSWSALAENGNHTSHGADTFVVRNGLIVAQTIHYEVSGQPTRREPERLVGESQHP